MKSRLAIGDNREFKHVVEDADIAVFDTGMVHPVCSTFALAKFIEWTSRLFIIDIKKEDEEGIGTKLHIEHLSPAFVGEDLNFKATITSINRNELICNVLVSVGNRKVAIAKTGQKLLLKHRLNEIFSSLEIHGKKR